MSVQTAGDRAWDGAGSDTISEFVSVVREHAKAIDGHVGVDEVHDLRTSTRRLRTAIKLHRDDAPKRRRDAVEDELKRLTRRLGAVRDLDVVLEELDVAVPTLPGAVDQADVAPLRDAWRVERRAGARRLRAELGRGRFGRALDRAAGLVPAARGSDASPGAEVPRVATKAPGLIWGAYGAVLAQDVDPRTADPAAIHQLRIAAKKLRYTLETFEDALEPGATLIREVTALQDAAGSMHDAIVAGERARSTVRPRDLSKRQRRAVAAFAEGRATAAESLRPTIARRLRAVRSRAFREALGRAVAGIGHP
jgi:CHAD domain-containing protein